MPKSKVRKKAAYAAPASTRPGSTKATAAGPSHPVYVVVMLGLLVLGLAWLVVNYLAPNVVPPISILNAIDGGSLAWANFAVGFGLIVVGLLMTMRWR